MVCLGFVVGVLLRGLPISCLRLPMGSIKKCWSWQPCRHVLQVVIISKLEIGRTKSCSAWPSRPVTTTGQPLITQSQTVLRFSICLCVCPYVCVLYNGLNTELGESIVLAE